MIFIKKYIFGVIFILIIVIIILLPKNIIPKEIEIDYEIIKEKEVNYIYFLEDETVVGIPFYDLEKNKYTLIEEIFKYLTEKSNSVSKEYHSELNLNSKLISYELRGDDIYLEVSDDFFKIDRPLLALAQVLYTYKELGFGEIYIMNNGSVTQQIENVVLYDGLSELPVNLEFTSNQSETKIIKITYYYRDGRKLFINHIVNSSEDEIKYKITKILSFINKKNNIDVKLLELVKNDDVLQLEISCNEKDVFLVKKILMENLKIKDEDILVTN